MMSPTALAVMPARQYIEHFHLDFYLREALSLFGSSTKGNEQSASELLGSYFQAVLQGEHTQSNSYRYLKTTPENRRAFVVLLRRALHKLESDGNSLAVTVNDFHDLLLPVCGDFPLSVVEEAAEYASHADGNLHRLIGEARPFGTQQTSPETSDRGCHGEESPLLVLRSLQRLLEFCFVYSEVLFVVKHLFQEHAEKVAGGSAASDRVARATLVKHLKAVFTSDDVYNIALPGAALPSERALQRLLQGRQALAAPVDAGLTQEEAVLEMAELFELEPLPIPRTLLSKVSQAQLSSDHAKEGDPAEEQSSSGAGASEPLITGTPPLAAASPPPAASSRAQVLLASAADTGSAQRLSFAALVRPPGERRRTERSLSSGVLRPRRSST
eukprot:TRINITY_DN83061_c0_g1_i1.p1 TRINITY_DN83061_c0_g1~~TRINITY_DN83061_c0_g1_i1.p1  ORF type:complete len:386 (-),score=93.81 TRINITY_DN83061_c0_g1_i1:84-1241(-)